MKEQQTNRWRSSADLTDLLPLTTEQQGDKPPKPANAIVAGAEIK